MGVKWHDTIKSLEGCTLDGQPVPLRSVNLALRSEKRWARSLELLQRLHAWRLRGDTVTLNSCLRSWPWQRGLAIMATSLEVDVITCNTGIAGIGPWPQTLVMFDSFQRSTVQADTITFNSLLSRVWTLAGCLLHMRGRSLETNVRLAVTAVAMNSAIAAGPWHCSTSLLHKGRSATVVSYNALAAACEKSSKWTSTLLVLESLLLNGFQRNLVMCNTAISACETCKIWCCPEMFNCRRSTAEALLACGLPLADVVTFNATLSATGQSQKWHRSLDILEHLQQSHVEASVVTCNSTIGACGSWVRGCLLLRDLADVVTCNAMLNTCGTWETAWWLLGAMSDRRCDGNAVSCGTVVARCREQWRTAWHLLAQMERQVQGNEVVYSALLSCCEQGEDWRAALAVLALMQDANGLEKSLANVIAINAAISACEKCKRWREALSLLVALQAQRQDDVVSHSAAIGACQLWPMALWLFATMAQAPDVQCCNAVVGALTGATQWAKALETLSAMGSYQLRGNAITLNACIDACERSGRWWEVLLLLANLDEQMALDPALDPALKAG
eukprot:s22_g46.t1